MAPNAWVTQREDPRISGDSCTREADTLTLVASDEVNELARTVTELAALLRTQVDQAVQNGQSLDRLSSSLSQVAMLIEDLQERVAQLEEKQHPDTVESQTRERR